MFLNHSVYEAIFKLASSGRYIRLKAFLEARTEEEIQMATKFKFGGATPLIMACRNGHKNIVEYLVKECNADVEEAGAVMFDHETVEGAPPLWCAAAAGHLQIVQFLIEKGAQVNSKTRTNSTPLRAACFDGHFGVVKYLIENGADFEVSNRHGHTCLMIACYKGHYKIVKYLLSLNADMNRKSSKGNTALHDCAEAGSIEILKLLLAHGARMDVDSYGMTPLLAAAVVGHQHIVEHLISLPIISRKDKIDALELLGATFVDRKKEMSSGVELWKRAMDLRYAEGEPPISKPHNPQTIDAYEHAQEIYDPESLDEILSDPDAIKNQALLIRERILGPSHPDTIYFLRYRGAMYADSGKFSRCISLWNYALDMQQSMLEPLNHMTLSTFYSFSELFEYLLSEKGIINARGRRLPIIAANEIIKIIEKCLLEAKSAVKFNITDESLLTKLITITLNLTALVTIHWAVYPESSNNRNLLDERGTMNNEKIKLSKDEQYRLFKTLFEFVKLNIRGRDQKSILHFSCQTTYLPPHSPNHNNVYKTLVPLIPDYDVTKLLCDVGADTNDIDIYNNTPLHILSNHFNIQYVNIYKILLNNGAHYDTKNKNNATFLALLYKQIITKFNYLYEADIDIINQLLDETVVTTKQQTSEDNIINNIDDLNEINEVENEINNNELEGNDDDDDDDDDNGLRYRRGQQNINDEITKDKLFNCIKYKLNSVKFTSLQCLSAKCIKKHVINYEHYNLPIYIKDFINKH